MKEISQVRITLEPAAFAALSEILSHIRLGNRNKWEEAISDWYIAAEKDGMQELAEQVYNQEGIPRISFEASDSEGVVINLN